jgi:hypothetical protein
MTSANHAADPHMMDVLLAQPRFRALMDRHDALEMELAELQKQPLAWDGTAMKMVKLKKLRVAEEMERLKTECQ